MLRYIYSSMLQLPYLITTYYTLHHQGSPWVRVLRVRGACKSKRRLLLLSLIAKLEKKKLPLTLISYASLALARPLTLISYIGFINNAHLENPV